MKDKNQKLNNIEKSISNLYKLFEALSNSISNMNKCKLERITRDELIGCYCSTHDKHAVVEKGENEEIKLLPYQKVFMERIRKFKKGERVIINIPRRRVEL